MVRSILLNLTGGEMVNFREAFKISIAFVGVVVGAGFASGQDIMQFFTSFGLVGLVGAVISGALSSDERRVGNVCVRTCSSRWSPSHYTQTAHLYHLLYSTFYLHP